MEVNAAACAPCDSKRPPLVKATAFAVKHVKKGSRCAFTLW
jgi:hypothetical protein